MKKFVAFSMGALMALGFSACSDDDVVDPASTLSSDATAYMHVNIIVNDEASTRAGDESVLEIGADNENNITRMQFYFFDSQKKFLSMSEYAEEIKFTDGTPGKTENIESTSSEDIILLSDYDPTNPPQYVITVLNAQKTEVMKKGQSMEDFYALNDGAFKILNEKSLKNESSDWYTIPANDENSFVMSTTTYKRTDSNIPSYVTDLTGVEFYSTKEKAEKETDKSKYANIYVERLAAKVGVDFDNTNVKTKWKYGANRFKLGKFDLNNTGEKNTVLYAYFTGWGLDGTAKETYYSKHINTAWATDLLGTNNPWNISDLYRSYWAASCYYNEGTITQEGQKFDTEYHNYSTGTSGNYWQSGKENSYFKGYSLNFINAEEATQAIGTPLYCGENTNSSAFISNYKNVAGVVTTVLMKAQLQKLVDGDYKSAGDIVKYAGNYYEAEVLAKKFLAAINATDYYFKDAAADADAAYEKLTESELTYYKDTDLLNGRVKIKVDTVKVPKTVKFYQAEKTTTGEGENATTSTTYKEIEGVTVESINYQLDDVQDDHVMVKYTDGWMYYYTPIYHLSNKSISKDGTIPEGYYGVVRNHWYKVTITGFKKSKDESPYNPSNPDGDDDDPGYGPEGPDDDKDPIDPGHGVDDPDEPIIPTTEEDVNYYLGANINVLSWRVVKQSVKL
jgi:hypothetical protein